MCRCIKSWLSRTCGEETVGVRPGFPIQGVALLMGNDLAGRKVLVTH